MQYSESEQKRILREMERDLPALVAVEQKSGKYEVIVPPAGALVSELPDDYDIITLDGMEFYKVDDTVYKMSLVEGKPYLEVLGQMYGTLARKYNYNYNNVTANPSIALEQL